MGEGMGIEKKGVKCRWKRGKVESHVEREGIMSKGLVAGLALLAGFVVVLITTSGKSDVNLFGWVFATKTSYAMLASAGIGVVAGALLRK